MQKIQLDINNHPATNLLKNKKRFSRIEIIKDTQTNEEQITIDFDIFQDETKEIHTHKNLIVVPPGYKHIN